MFYIRSYIQRIGHRGPRPASSDLHYYYHYHYDDHHHHHLHFIPGWDDYRPAAGLMHINEHKFSLYGGAADYQPSRLAGQSLNSMQLQHQPQQPVVKLLLLQSSYSIFRQSQLPYHTQSFNAYSASSFQQIKHSYL